MIEEIESVEEQYDMLINFSPELQILLLEDAVTSFNYPLSKLGLNMLVDAWMEGDEASLKMMVAEDTAAYTGEEYTELYDEFNEAMYKNRNIIMADYAEEALNDGENVFICVGAAHVVSEGGIVDLLEERGYTVTQITN